MEINVQKGKICWYILGRFCLRQGMIWPNLSILDVYHVGSLFGNLQQNLQANLLLNKANHELFC